MCHSSSHSQVHGISTDTVAAINTPLKSRKLASSRCNEFLTWFSLVLCANNQQVRQVRQQDSVNTSYTLGLYRCGAGKIMCSTPSSFFTLQIHDNDQKQLKYSHSAKLCLSRSGRLRDNTTEVFLPLLQGVLPLILLIDALLEP